MQLEDSTLLKNAVAVTAGEKFACAVTESGAAYCWSQDNRGQLGINDNADRNVATRVYGIEDETGNTLLGDVAGISAGKEHACAATLEGQGLCWGEANNGQLGNDYVLAPVLYPWRVWGVDGVGLFDNAATLTAGGEYSCGLDRKGRALCWGLGEAGQLGTGIGEPGYRELVPAKVKDIASFLTVNFTGNGAGDVMAVDGSISCATTSGACTEEFSEGDQVVLLPLPASNSVFEGWTDPCVLNGDRCRVTLDQDETVTATFVQALPPQPKPTKQVASYNQDVGRLVVRVQCPKRFKPRCKGRALAVTALGKKAQVMSKPVKINRKAGKWVNTVFQIKPKFRTRVAMMATVNKKQLFVRQVLKLKKKKKKARQVKVHHRYKVRLRG